MSCSQETHSGAASSDFGAVMVKWFGADRATTCFLTAVVVCRESGLANDKINNRPLPTDDGWVSQKTTLLSPSSSKTREDHDCQSTFPNKKLEAVPATGFSPILFLADPGLVFFCPFFARGVARNYWNPFPEDSLGFDFFQFD